MFENSGPLSREDFLDYMKTSTKARECYENNQHLNPERKEYVSPGIIREICKHCGYEDLVTENEEEKQAMRNLGKLETTFIRH